MWLLLATAVLLGVAGWSRLLQGTWAAPGAFFALIWVIAAAPAALFLPDYVTPGAMLLVVSFVVAVLLGSQLALQRLPAAWEVRSGRAVTLDRRNEQARVPILSTMSALLAACGFAAFVGYVWDAGYTLAQLADRSTWLDLALRYSVARYQESFVEPVSIRLLVAANYAGALTGGVLLATGSGLSRRLLGVASALAATMITIVTTAKTVMLVSALFTLAGWLSFKVAMPLESRRRHSLKRWLVSAAIFVVLAAIGTASLVLRYGEGTTADVVVGRIGGYLFGHMAALSAWLAVEDWSHLQPTWGVLSFAGPAETLDLTARTTPGFYNPIALNFWAGESNVFTALRGMITDFGLIGAWFAAMLSGAFGGCCYARLGRGDGGTSASMTGLAVFYGFAAWSPLVSILAYNVVMLAIVITVLTLDAAWSEIRTSSVGYERRLLELGSRTS